MLPATYDLEIYQGDYFVLHVRIRSKNYNAVTQQWDVGDYVDLTGATPKAEIRPSAGSSDLLTTFVCTLDNQATTPGGVMLELDSEATAALPTSSPSAWDLQINYPGVKPRTYLRGAVTVTKEVTV